MMDFDAAFLTLLKHEGGFVNDSRDSGGKTRYGITEAVARENGYTGDMQSLPVEFAARVYKVWYWDAVRADDLPESLRYAVFDAAVNSGVGRATLWLQQAVGADQDGEIGPQTLRMAREAKEAKSAICGIRLEFMASLPNWPAFGRGWARRVASILQEA